MTARKKFLIAPVAALILALSWTTFGSSTASGQEAPIRIARAHKGARQPSFDRPLFFLILGGDARTGNPDRQRVDSIHILGIDPVKKRASILGIPRDSYFDSPCGGQRKITDTGYCAGVEGALRAIESFSKCQFDYYMVTAFEGFRGRKGSKIGGLINQLGGVTMNVNETLTMEIPVAVKRGRNKLSGAEALSYARNRKERAGGDFGRSAAQGRLMIAVLRELRGDYKRDPGTALRNLGVIRRNVKMDIGLKEALDLGLMALKLSPSKVDNEVVDGAIGSAGSASIVRITARGRNQLADICADGLLDQS